MSLTIQFITWLHELNNRNWYMVKMKFQNVGGKVGIFSGEGGIWFSPQNVSICEQGMPKTTLRAEISLKYGSLWISKYFFRNEENYFNI